jgi:hypothetical protein
VIKFVVLVVQSCSLKNPLMIAIIQSMEANTLEVESRGIEENLANDRRIVDDGFLDANEV